MKTKYFGTDGIRGEVNSFLTPEVSYKLGLSLATFYNEKFKKTLCKYEKCMADDELCGKKSAENNEENQNKKAIFIASDTRKTKDLIIASVAAGIMAGGINVVYGGILPSGAVSFVTNKYSYLCGIMITASHNDAKFNGIKVFNENGCKLTIKEEKRIEDSFEVKLSLVNSDKVGTFIKSDKPKKDYIKFLQSKFSYKFYNKRIVIGAAFGAGGDIVKKIFDKEKFINVTLLSCEEDGEKINSKASSLDMSEIVKTVIDTKSDFGFALDGDADRIGLVLSDGTILTGDELLYLIADNMKLNNELKNNIVVSTIASNTGLEIALNKKKIKLVKTEIGDRYVCEKILELNANLGGEKNGHIIFADDLRTSDGVLNLVKLLNMFETIDRSEIKQNVSKIKLFDYVEKKANISENYKKVIKLDKKFKEAIYQSESIMATTGRVFVRVSGTESVVRIVVEGTDAKLNEKVAGSLKKFIEDESSLTEN